MSILVYRDGVFAADTASFRGDFIVKTNARKIIRTAAGYLVGCAGVWQYGERFNAWAMAGFPEDGKPPPIEKEDDFGALVVHPDGTVTEYSHDMTSADCTDEIMGHEGRGFEFALALATLGWSAEEIVAHAIKHCVWAGGEVYALRLEASTEDEEPTVDLGIEEDSGPWTPEGAWPQPAVPSTVKTFLVDKGLA